MSQLFSATPEQVRPLLQGSPTTIQSHLNAERAEQYRQALARVGVGFEIVEEVPELSLAPHAEDSVATSPEETASDPGLPACPKCGYQAKTADDPLLTKYDGMGECPKCGIMPKNYIKRQLERQQAEPSADSDEEPTVLAEAGIFQKKETYRFFTKIDPSVSATTKRR